MEEVYGVVYLITNTVNGKGYVGQTTQTVKQRFSEHCCRRETYIGRAINHYGRKNFKCEILKTCATKAELDEWEIFYIATLDTKVPNGYNIADGGGGTVGCKHTPETCAKISALLSGKNHPLFGQHLPPEYCSKISAANRGYSPFKNLVRELDERHLSYSALARLMGFSSHKNVSLKMCGKIIFTDKDKAKFVEIFGKPIEYLLECDEDSTCAKPPVPRPQSPYKNLLRELETRGLCYNHLAEMLGLSHSSVRAKMRGKIIFTERDRAKLVEIFGKPIEYLLARDDG